MLRHWPHRAPTVRARPFEGNQSCTQLALGPRQYQRVHRHLATFFVDDELEALGKERTQHAALARAPAGLGGWQVHRGVDIEAIARHPARSSEDLERLQ